MRTPFGDPDWVPIRVYMREVKLALLYNFGHNSHMKSRSPRTHGCQLFGLPIVVTVPLKGCRYHTLYETILNQTKQYVKKPCDIEVKQEKKRGNDCKIISLLYPCVLISIIFSIIDTLDEKTLFKLVVLEPNGTTVIKQLSNGDQLLHLTSERLYCGILNSSYLGNTYIGCEWEQHMKDKYYDVVSAMVRTTL